MVLFMDRIQSSLLNTVFSLQIASQSTQINRKLISTLKFNDFVHHYSLASQYLITTLCKFREINQQNQLTCHQGMAFLGPR